jgi:hypothetical protein
MDSGAAGMLLIPSSECTPPPAQVVMICWQEVGSWRQGAYFGNRSFIEFQFDALISLAANFCMYDDYL